MCVWEGGGGVAVRHSPPPYFPADFRNNPAKTSLHWFPSSSVVWDNHVYSKEKDLGLASIYFFPFTPTGGQHHFQ